MTAEKVIQIREEEFARISRAMHRLCIGRLNWRDCKTEILGALGALDQMSKVVTKGNKKNDNQR